MAPEPGLAASGKITHAIKKCILIYTLYSTYSKMSDVAIYIAYIAVTQVPIVLYSAIDVLCPST